MQYIQSGQFNESYPDKQPCIKILFSNNYPEIVDKYLNKLKELNSTYNCELKWEYDPR